MKPSYKDIESKLLETERKLLEAEAKLIELHRLLKLAIERIAELEERLNKNSQNSSKPPSSDQKANGSGIQSSRKSRSKGMNRQSIPEERVDRFVTCTLEACTHCGSKNLLEIEGAQILQQVELPQVRATVTQFSCAKHWCKCCGQQSFAPLPPGVPNSAFGPRLMGLITTLTGALQTSKRDAMQLVKDLYDIEICEGSVINVEERVATVLSNPYERIHEHVMRSIFAKHFDETSWRDRGRNHYVWVGSTVLATCLHIDAHRSKAAFEQFSGCLAQAPVITDRYGVYAHLNQPHQYCLAHLIRDFRKYAERDGPDGVIGRAIEEELRQVCKNHRQFRRGEISKRSRAVRFRHQKIRLDNHLLDGLANGSDELSALCERLLDSYERLWTFSEYVDVEPTNNLAERDLRRVVLWRKKSYGTRSERGQRYVERISSVVGTLRKAGRNVFEYICQAIAAYYRGDQIPMINPTLGF